jgi:hypothetical protein
MKKLSIQSLFILAIALLGISPINAETIEIPRVDTGGDSIRDIIVPDVDSDDLDVREIRVPRRSSQDVRIEDDGDIKVKTREGGHTQKIKVEDDGDIKIKN